MDNRILSELYNAYAREIYLYLYSLCKDAQLAEDLMQESFCKAILALSSEHTNMRAWLYTVARNLCLNELKKRNRESYDNNLHSLSNLLTNSSPHSSRITSSPISNRTDISSKLRIQTTQ